MTIGKTEKVYPVVVEKHRVKGDTLVFDSMDRGRTLVDDDGDKTFELMNEPYAEGLIKYEDFEQTIGGGNRVTLAMIDRDKFVPMHKNYDFSKETYLDDKPWRWELIGMADSSSGRYSHRTTVQSCFLGFGACRGELQG